MLVNQIASVSGTHLLHLVPGWGQGDSMEIWTLSFKCGTCGKYHKIPRCNQACIGSIPYLMKEANNWARKGISSLPRTGLEAPQPSFLSPISHTCSLWANLWHIQMGISQYAATTTHAHAQTYFLLSHLC